VAVIGGSLAGSAAAGALARGGARVVVLERARFPRPKICGEFLSHEARPVLERLGALDDVLAAGPETITRFAVVRPSGRRLEAGLPAPVLSLSRACLDGAVARAAERLGAQRREGVTVTGVEGDLERGFRLETTGGGLTARAVVGAWGRYTALDGQLGRPFYRRPASLFGFQKHLQGAAEGLRGRAVLHLFRGGYLGLSLVEGGAVNLAALASPEVAKEAHHDVDRLLARLTAESAALRADLEGLTPLPGPVLVSEPVHLGRREPLAGDILLAGDAAGVIDPYTGTGMALALLTGEAAASALLEYLCGRLNINALRAAQRRAQAAIAGRRFLWSRYFRPFFAGGFASRFLAPAAAPLARLAARLTRG